MKPVMHYLGSHKMVKMILAVLVSMFVIVSTVVVLYWRDTGHNPSSQDLLIFFGLLPFALSLLIVMPFFIKKWYQESQEKKNQAQTTHQDPVEVNTVSSEPVERIELNIWSATAYSALGENDGIWEQLKNFKSPELDPKLQNGYGLPILSYRIADLDDSMDDDQDKNDEHDHFGLSQRQVRIQALLQQQLEQNTESLWSIAEHLKQSALFYEGQLAHEYRMHPAWIDPSIEHNDELETERSIEQVARLNQLNIHVVLAEDLLHTWDESSTQEKVAEFLNELGIIPQKFHVEFHYWGKETAYKQWMDVLKQLSKAELDVSFVMVVDSEIDQDSIDEKTWISDHYIPSEFVASCCIAGTSVLINQMTPQKVIKIALNEHQLFNTLEQLQSQTLVQYDQEQPFVMQLDDATDIKVIKRLEQNFSETPIEQHHYLFMKQSIGQTENLAKIFGFMLGMHASEDLVTLVYSCDQPQTQTVIQPFLEQQTTV